MTTRHSTLFTLGAGKSGLSFYTTQRDAAKDFPDGHIVVGTPLAIHRWIAVPQLEHYVQAVLLSDRGTLLFFGRLHHESSIGPILESGGSVTVVANEKGFYQTQGRRSQEM